MITSKKNPNFVTRWKQEFLRVTGRTANVNRLSKRIWKVSTRADMPPHFMTRALFEEGIDNLKTKPTKET